MIRNYLTTIPGVLVIIVGLVRLWTSGEVDSQTIGILTTGAGLIAAKAYNVTGTGKEKE